jgi:dTMP kinase
MVWYVIDGLDGSGKTTAGRMLRDQLESSGRTVALITHPNPQRFFGRLSGRMLYRGGDLAVVLAALFFFIDLVGSLARMPLRRADDVIFIRYTMSACYLPRSRYRRVYRIMSALLPEPDVRILMDIDGRTAMRRIESRGGELERFENIDSLNEVGQRMRSLSDGWTVVDARLPLEAVEEMIGAIAVASGPGRS